MIKSEKEFEEICANKLNMILNLAGQRKRYIYGAGGKIFVKVLEKNNETFEAYIDKKAEEILEINEHKVVLLCDVDKDNAYIIIALRGYVPEVVEDIRRAGFEDNQIYVVASGGR